MRTFSLFAGFALALSLSACDSTGIDLDGGGDGGSCDGYHCGGDTDGSGNGDDGTTAALDIDPRQTYLRTSDDDAVDAPAVSLTDLGFEPGDPVCFRVEGDFSLVENYWASERGDGYLTAVFSSTDRLADSSELFRVPDALDAGDDVFTLDTDRNGLQTDIDEDFRADDVCLTVPDGAEYVFFGAYDSYYADNDTIDGTPFRVRIEK